MLGKLKLAFDKENYLYSAATAAPRGAMCMQTDAWCLLQTLTRSGSPWNKLNGI